MMQAYVGIVSQRGIEGFWPEDPHTVRFLSRRVRRTRGRIACFWTVMPDEAVVDLHDALATGGSMEALEFLHHMARDFGTLLPFDD